MKLRTRMFESPRKMYKGSTGFFSKDLLAVIAAKTCKKAFLPLQQ
jgi:hypothetical protein